MISKSIFDTEELPLSLKDFKLVANDVRIYFSKININALNNQIAYRQKNEKFIINNPQDGFKIEIPFWLNVIEGSYDLVSCYPDIQNISNATIMIQKNKANEESLKDFYEKITKSKPILECTEVTNGNKKLKCFYIKMNSGGNIFYCQYVFFETKQNYGLICFTATEKTYEKNIDRFNELLRGIELSN